MHHAWEYTSLEYRADKFHGILSTRKTSDLKVKVGLTKLCTNFLGTHHFLSLCESILCRVYNYVLYVHALSVCRVLTYTSYYISLF